MNGSEPTIFPSHRLKGLHRLRWKKKKHYNEMLVKAMADGVQPLHGFRSSLNKVEGTDWMIADGAEALIGHEVLDWLGGKATNATADTFWNEYGAVDQRINEYGFAMDMPGVYKGLSYMTAEIVNPDLDFWGGQWKETANGWEPVEGTGKWNHWAGSSTIIKAPSFGMDGGMTYAPEINFTDALGLGGMSLADRKLFLGKVQGILDEVAPGMEARQLKFSVGQLTADDVRNGTVSLTLADAGGLSKGLRDSIEQALNQTRQLVDMKLRADASGNKGLGGFTISVLDAQGNALAKDQVRLIADDKSVTTSVDTIRDLDHSQIYDFVTKGVLPNW